VYGTGGGGKKKSKKKGCQKNIAGFFLQKQNFTQENISQKWGEQRTTPTGRGANARQTRQHPVSAVGKGLKFRLMLGETKEVRGIKNSGANNVGGKRRKEGNRLP